MLLLSSRKDKYFRFNPDSELHGLDFTDLTCAVRYEPIIVNYTNKPAVIAEMNKCGNLGFSVRR